MSEKDMFNPLEMTDSAILRRELEEESKRDAEIDMKIAETGAGYMVKGKFSIIEIGGHSVKKVLPRMENEENLFMFINEPLDKMLDSYLNKGTDNSFKKLCTEFDESNTNNYLIDIGFTQTNFKFGGVCRNSTYKVEPYGLVEDEEWVQVTGRSTRPWAKDKRAEVIISFKLREDNCKKLASMFASKEFSDIFALSNAKVDNFTIGNVKKFMAMYGKKEVKEIDHSDLFRKENKENTLKK